MGPWFFQSGWFMSAKPLVIIAARWAPDYAGGLAEYQRQLAAHLEPTASTAFVALQAGRADSLSVCPKATFLTPPASFRPALKIWMHLAPRPILHPLLRFWVAADCLRELPLPESPPRAVHFIGTGWDFFGFAMERYARRTGARFTVWPAVHPWAWGDDVVDTCLYRLADTVFCQSESERRHLSGRGVPEELMKVTGLPPMCRADGDGKRLRARLGISDRPAVLFMGRRDAGKGYDALIEAWPAVLGRHPEAVLLIAGTGDRKSPALPKGSFRDLGVPTGEEKADALDACDVFCLPSRHEAFGIVFAEAWSYGKPVVCGMAPAPREWVTDGVNGLWTDGKAPGIASALISLIRDKAFRISLGAAGREIQRTRLTWENVLRVHLEAFGLPVA